MEKTRDQSYTLCDMESALGSCAPAQRDAELSSARVGLSSQRVKALTLRWVRGQGGRPGCGSTRRLASRQATGGDHVP